MIEKETHTVAPDVDDIVGARAVDIGQTYALLAELVNAVEPWSVIHGDLGAEPAVAEVGPVANLAFADAYQVGQPIAAHVGQVDGLRAVSEEQTGPFLFIGRRTNLRSSSKTLFRLRRIPPDRLILGDQHVRMAVAVQVYEPQIWFLPRQVGKVGEFPEWLPILIVGALVETRRGAGKRHQVELTVTG
ncbi:MAG: hypothetical protein WBL40_12305, partial [Terrimicrobiaceae bacterium]